MLDNKIVLITHATHFVGGPAAREMAAQGARVVCHDESFTDAAAREAFAAERAGVETTDKQTPADLLADMTERYGRVDVLVNNDAFPALRASVEEADLEDMRRTLEALVVQPFALAQAVLPGMRERKAGKIIFVTSAAPFHGLPNYSMYVTGRGATNALTLSLAKEVARHNIQVNALAPNFVESPTYFPPELLANPEAKAKIVKNIPLGRLGKPQEAAATIVFLASPGADFITGHVLPFAGGWA
ncbi:MAG: SDR family oxidoreductase [Minwuiales bacterium]|nr:SDR family oxidoreductase [Minwuiales bacterium]